MYSSRQMSPPVLLQCDAPTTRLVQFIISLAMDLTQSHPWKSLNPPKVCYSMFYITNFDILSIVLQVKAKLPTPSSPPSSNRAPLLFLAIDF